MTAVQLVILLWGFVFSTTALLYLQRKKYKKESDKQTQWILRAEEEARDWRKMYLKSIQNDTIDHTNVNR